MARSKNYRDLLIQSLKDPEEAAAYFNAILKECRNCDEQEAQKLLLLAVKNITEAPLQEIQKSSKKKRTLSAAKIKTKNLKFDKHEANEK